MTMMMLAGTAAAPLDLPSIRKGSPSLPRLSLLVRQDSDTTTIETVEPTELENITEEEDIEKEDIEEEVNEEATQLQESSEETPAKDDNKGTSTKKSPSGKTRQGSRKDPDSVTPSSSSPNTRQNAGRQNNDASSSATPNPSDSSDNNDQNTPSDPQGDGGQANGDGSGNPPSGGDPQSSNPSPGGDSENNNPPTGGDSQSGEGNGDNENNNNGSTNNSQGDSGNNSDNKPKEEGAALSTGAIAGIAAGGGVLLLVVLVGLIALVRSRRGRSDVDFGDAKDNNNDSGKRKRSRKGDYVDFNEIHGSGDNTERQLPKSTPASDREIVGRESDKLIGEKGEVTIEPLATAGRIDGDRHAEEPTAPVSGKFGWLDSRISASSDDTIVAPPLAVEAPQQSAGVAPPVSINKSGSKIAPWFVDLRSS